MMNNQVSVPPFEYLHRVTYADCTVGNHVFYSRYLDFLEAARGDFFRKLGRRLLEWQEQGTIFPVVECRLRYKTPARYDDNLRISLRPTLAKGVRLNFAYQIFNQQGALVLEAQTFHACTGLDERPKRLPGDLSAALLPYLDDTRGREAFQ